MRRVAIAGLGPTHDDVPWSEWETWGVAWDAWFPRYSLGFEMHDRQLWTPKHLERMKRADIPILMQKECEDVSMSRAYPRYAVELTVGRDYMGSSIAYMLAYAIYRKADEIGLWGVDLSDDMHDHQRPNLEYLIGFAEGRGIKVHVPKGSVLLSGGGYGEVEWQSQTLAN